MTNVAQRPRLRTRFGQLEPQRFSPRISILSQIEPNRVNGPKNRPNHTLDKIVRDRALWQKGAAYRDVGRALRNRDKVVRAGIKARSA
jgi:hypothetical protein